MSSISDQTFIAQVASPEDLAFLDFADERAIIEVPGPMLAYMPFEVSEPLDEGAYEDALETTRATGFDASEPLTLEPRPGGRWMVDAHDAARFKAARQVAGEMMSNLFSQKVRKVRFILLETSFDGKFRAARNELNYRAN